MLGPYISALEHKLVTHPALVKGLDLDKRMDKLNGNNHDRKRLSDYSTFLETDYSRFDLSISGAYIKRVEKVFLALPYSHDPGYLSLLPWLEETRGISELGVSYNVVGTRCSGDAHTSICNGLINHFNTWLAMMELDPRDWVSFHEGDDGIIGVAAHVADQAVHNMHIMPLLGYQLKLDVYHDVSDTSFCGRYLYDSLEGCRSYCDVRRTLSKFHTICSDGDPQALLLAKMISYYCTDRDTPVVGVLSTVIIQLLLPIVSTRRLVRALDRMRLEYWFREKHKSHLMVRTSYPLVMPDAYLRASVANRSGISVAQQQLYESYYLSWLNLGHIPSEIHKLPGEWTVKSNMHVHGNPGDWVA